MNASRLSIPYWLETLFLFKLCWLLLVLGQNAGILPALVLLAVGFSRFPGPLRALRPVLVTALAGITLDLALTRAGLFAFGDAYFAPWLVVLWLAFAHALHNALHFLQRWPLAGVAAVGGLTGPISYFLGYQLGAVDFPASLPPTLAVLALCWALLLPLALCAGRRLVQQARLPLSAVLLLVLMLPLLPVATAASDADAEGPDLILLGEARLRVFFRTVYDVRLYAEHERFDFPSTDAYRLELAYGMDISSANLLRETRRQWNVLGIAAPPEWISTLAAVLPSVTKGDRLALEVTDGHGVLTYNGRVSGSLDDPALVAAFAGIWLAENTTQPQLRSQLLRSPK